jgi:Flp pilus assembly protein TadG
MNFFDSWKSPRRMRSAGQALVLIVITFFGLVIFLGLMIDLGQIFLAKGYLRRAADAAALAAAAQYRENRTIAEMTAAAQEVARINGIDAATIQVQTCLEGNPGPDTSLCSPAGTMPKKLVRVTVDVDYPMTFLRLIDINEINLVESSVSEAASMDVVLVIDVGESMAWDIDADEDKNYDVDPANPAFCNTDNSCLPFKNVKSAAMSFAAEILNKIPGKEEDRLSVVTFANGWEAGSQGTSALWGSYWTDDLSVAQSVATGIPSLKVYEASQICPLNNDMACGGPDPIACYATVEDIPAGPCVYVGDQSDSPSGLLNNFWGYNCARLWDIDTADGGHWTGSPEAMSACTTTNIGGGLRRAGEQFAFEKRLDALWVVVVLTDGAANATYALDQDLDPLSGTNELVTDPAVMPLNPDLFVPNLPLGYCPDGTWVGRGTGHPNRMFCQDGRVDTYHSLMTDPTEYDADDFARDQAKFVACAAAGTPNASCMGQRGQGAVIFTIGLGNEVTDLVDENPVYADRKPYGAELLRYIAAIGDDGDADTDPCASVSDYKENCGNYFYAQESTDLERVFEMIYSRIFTRLTM